MKNAFKSVLFVMLMTTMIPLTSKANTETGITTPVAAAQSDAQRVNNRINEIKSMNTKNMTNRERREIRKELKALKKSDANGGIYLSAGAVILIVILLIILL